MAIIVDSSEIEKVKKMHAGLAPYLDEFLETGDLLKLVTSAREDGYKWGVRLEKNTLRENIDLFHRLLQGEEGVMLTDT